MRVSVRLARVTGAMRCRHSMFKHTDHGTITLHEFLADTLANVDRAIKRWRHKKTGLRKRKAKK